LKQEENPGSITGIEADSEGRFTRCVIVPHGCAVAAVMTPKRVMFGDGFFLKGDLGGTGIIYTMTSAEKELVCVALVICDVENASNYKYGLDAMKRHSTLGPALTDEVRRRWKNAKTKFAVTLLQGHLKPHAGTLYNCIGHVPFYWMLRRACMWCIPHSFNVRATTVSACSERVPLMRLIFSCHQN
jgi:hypothetical protein